MKVILIKTILMLLKLIGAAVVLYIGAVIAGYGAALGVISYLSYLERKKTQNYLKASARKIKKEGEGRK